MEINEKLKAWFNTMGYQEDLDFALKIICNPSTSYIWEQVISKIKPNKEVHQIKTNIILEQLRERPKKNQVNIPVLIDIYEEYKEKQLLLRKKEILLNKLSLKINQVEKVLYENKLKYVLNDINKESIQENYQKIYLLKKKSELIVDDIKKSKDTLISIQSLTPIEEENESTEKQILDTLIKCTKKLDISSVKSKPNESITGEKSTQNILFSTPKKSSGFSRFTSMICLSSRNPTEKRESLGVLLPESMDKLFFESEDNSDEIQITRNQEILKKNELQRNTHKHFKEKVYNNSEFFSSLTELLQNSNRFNLAKCCHNIKINFESESCKIVLNSKSNITNISRCVEKSKVYFTHIEMELKLLAALQLEKQLVEFVTPLKNQISTNILDDDLNKLFNLQLKKNKLNKMEENYCKIINFLDKIEDFTTKLNLILEQTKKVNYEKDIKFQESKQFYNDLKFIYSINDMKKNQIFSNEMLVFSFEQIQNSLQFFSENVHTSEVRIFEKFPLSYNARKNDKVYTTSIPHYISCSEEDLNTLVRIIDAPYNSTDIIVNDMEEMIKKIKYLNSLDSKHFFSHKNYNLEEMQLKEEEFLETSIYAMSILINSPQMKKLLSFRDTLFKICKTWFESNFGDLISPNRMLDGRNFKSYEKEIDDLTLS